MLITAKWAKAAEIVNGPESEILRAYNRHKRRQQTFKQTFLALPAPEQARIPGAEASYKQRKVVMVKRGEWIASWENMVRLACMQELLTAMLRSGPMQLNTAAVVHRVFKNSNSHLRSIVERGIGMKPEMMLAIGRQTVKKYDDLGHDIPAIKSAQRGRQITIVRRECLYRCVVETPFSLPAIGKYFGGRDHTTVLHNFRKYRYFQYGLLGFVKPDEHEWLTIDRDRIIPLRPEQISENEIEMLEHWKR